MFELKQILLPPAAAQPLVMVVLAAIPRCEKVFSETRLALLAIENQLSEEILNRSDDRAAGRKAVGCCHNAKAVVKNLRISQKEDPKPIVTKGFNLQMLIKELRSERSTINRVDSLAAKLENNSSAGYWRLYQFRQHADTGMVSERPKSWS